jgi:hypothetical protein
MNHNTNSQLEEIQKALQDRNLTAVSEATGLNTHTLYRLMRGKVSPNKSTLNLLTMYLQGQAVKA